MSKKYIKNNNKDTNTVSKKISSVHWLIEVVLAIVSFFSFYLMLILISFNPSDPSWSQTAWHNTINNLGGLLGAWFADILLSTFGVLAYTLPLFMIFFCWNIFSQRKRHNYVDLLTLSLRLIGSLGLIIASCGLTTLNVGGFYYFISGGIIGYLLSNAIVLWINNINSTLLLLCIWALGLTLFTGWSWLTIAEKIGKLARDCTVLLLTIFNSWTKWIKKIIVRKITMH